MTTTTCTSLWVLSASALLILLYFPPCNQNISISTLSISSATHHRSLMKKHSDLESVEDGLGKARKAIKDAIRLRKSSDHKNKNDTYIPRRDKYPYWNRSNGADHFYLSCHDWAPDVSQADPKFYKNLMRALCNANRSEGFEPQRDVSIPEINVPPSELGPSSASAQPPSNRSILGFFAGGAHGHIRHVLLQHWKDKDEEIKVHEYLENKGDYLVFMGQSKFCLCPSGYEVASPRVVTAIQLGCIPVTISDNYTLPFSDVLDWRPLQNINGTEGQFIDELMQSRKSRFLARHPDEAHTFFLPISVTNIRQFLYKPLVTYSRYQLQNVVTDYINVVADKYPYWNRTNGADHFFPSCFDWAPDISQADPALYKNFIRSLCNANRPEEFEPQRDISIPEINIPVGKLGPSTTSTQPPSGQSILGFFAGGAHGYIRHVLLHHWKDKDEEIQVHEYLANKEDYLVFMGQSKFCRCPSGFEVASPRLVVAIQLGCIPVIISDNYTLPFSDVLDWSKFSVNIPPAKIAEIKTIERGIK